MRMVFVAGRPCRSYGIGWTARSPRNVRWARYERFGRGGGQDYRKRARPDSGCRKIGRVWRWTSMTGIRIPPENSFLKSFSSLANFVTPRTALQGPSLLFEAYPVGAFFSILPRFWASIIFLRHPVELFQDNGLATHPGHEGHDQWTLWAFHRGAAAASA